MSESPHYRILFFNDRAMLVAHQELAAPSDAAAKLIGAAIFQACEDECASYEIWSGPIRLVTGMRPSTMPNVFELTHQLGSMAADNEERIAASAWALARSRKLLGTLGNWKARNAMAAAKNIEPHPDMSA